MKKYSDIIIINITFLLIGIGLFLLVDKKIEILGAVIATGISLSLGIRQSKTENDRIFKELFLEFNNRYETKFNLVLGEIITNYELDSGYELDIEKVNIVIAYFNFCAEEYLWKTKDRIPDSVWNSWENGMIYYLKNPLIYKIFFNERMQKNSYYGLYQRMENKLID